MTLYVVLPDLMCATCGESDQLWQDVTLALIECRACGTRYLAGGIEALDEGVGFGLDLYDDYDGWGA
ncbi:hypothetical protein ABZU75_21170 [Streptosporangium sp. NPDC005286]|uniref:hypothetical protein n=1 Tax=Streptosporangium sp. NPDC005286 TaxID=3154463 RepID=UPI0033AA708C